MNQVSEWKCDMAQFGDGVCDCGCGRSDWDCMGELGVPQKFVVDYLDNPDSDVTVNINCPEGLDKLVPLPENVEPTCSQLSLPSGVRRRTYESRSMEEP